MRAPRLLVLLVLVTTAGCGTQRDLDPAGPAASGSPPDLRPLQVEAVEALAPGPAGDPSDFAWGDEIFHFLTDEGLVVDAAPWAACLGPGCWDGAPGLGAAIRSVGSPDSLYVGFDYPGWRFERVSFNPVDDECGGRSITVPAIRVTDRVLRVDPAGLRGQWRVDVFGRAPAGDAVTSVLWTTGEQPPLRRVTRNGCLNQVPAAISRHSTTGGATGGG